MGAPLELGVLEVSTNPSWGSFGCEVSMGDLWGWEFLWADGCKGCYISLWATDH